MKGPVGKLMPAVVQDHASGEVLMVACVDDEALKRTRKSGTTWFWSRSRQEYWNKGETSGNKQLVKEIRYDCDEDTYLFLVEQLGEGACHTGHRSCFYRREPLSGEADISFEGSAAGVLADLYSVIEARKQEMPEGSYTAKLFKGGLDMIVAKVEEEGGEVIEAALEKEKKEVVWEAADLIYHLFVLMVERGISFEELAKELAGRRR